MGEGRVLGGTQELKVHCWEFMERKTEMTQKRVTAYLLFIL